MKRKLTKDEYQRLKNRLNAALSALRACHEFRDCLGDFPLEEALTRLVQTRDDCWQHGPDTVRSFHLRRLLDGQPNG